MSPRARSVPIGLLATLAAVSAGCPDRSVSAVPPTQAGVIRKSIPLGNDVDILFMIDNSASTRDKQQLFGSNFPAFISKLDQFQGGRPNLHIGVVSSTV